MLYKNEFGADFDLGFNLSDYPYLKDKSWHNDVSPSFYFSIGPQHYVLWVDHAYPAEREDSNSRYLIQEATNEGNETHPEIYSSDGDIVFEGERFIDVSNFLRSLKCHQGNIIS
ncbi:hypothetical protein [Shewanella sp. OMA3-2]|uniref:hypothetical protein n=1 Tax=Shewanella sp. OMA3-2 TaxID=2908650 RepID=UPI001F361E86|nr:hypothetical protein [Shewanella sp. OMA3-2]UJF22032.1 hypothetical protein L0B17_00765 [Shewanella sp. OMA3-2]